MDLGSVPQCQGLTVKGALARPWWLQNTSFLGPCTREIPFSLVCNWGTTESTSFQRSQQRTPRPLTGGRTSLGGVSGNLEAAPVIPIGLRPLLLSRNCGTAWMAAV